MIDFNQVNPSPTIQPVIDPILEGAAEAFGIDNFRTDESPSLFIGAADFLDSSLHVSYTIKGIIERDTTGQIFGPSGSGKTFVALDIALAIATGGTTLNGQAAERGLVLYFAGEGHGGLKRRGKAWQKANWHTKDKLDLFYLSRNTINFKSKDIRAAIAEGKRLVELHQQPITLIVIDTLARHLDGDENSAADMSAFIHAVDTLRSVFPGSVALIVHHTGHGEETKTRGRGSSALRAAMDFEILCDKGLLAFTKMKDGEAPKPIEFKLCPVQIGADESGEPITSCVVKYGERSAQNKIIELTAYEKLLVELIKDYPEVSELRIAFYDKCLETKPEVKPDSQRRNFDRSLEKLVSKQVINITDNYITTDTGQMPDLSGQ